MSWRHDRLAMEVCRGMGPTQNGTSGRRLSATAVTRGVSSCDNRHTWMTRIIVRRKVLTKLDPLTLYIIRISLCVPRYVSESPRPIATLHNPFRHSNMGHTGRHHPRAHTKARKLAVL